MDFLLGLGLALPIVASSAIGTVTGVAQGVSQQRKVNAEASDETRQLKFHLDVSAEGAGSRNQSSVDGGMVVLRDQKLYVEAKSPITRQPAKVTSHPFTGFYVTYPDEDRPMTRGLVSTISRDPPMLNWIYVDKDTYECKYSNRSGSIAHHVGDYDWTSEEGPDSCVTFDDWEGFLVVEEENDVWALYFDRDDDGLKSRRKGRGTLEVSLKRRIISEQEVNKWGIGREGNIGMKATREV